MNNPRFIKEFANYKVKDIKAYYNKDLQEKAIKGVLKAVEVYERGLITVYECVKIIVEI